MEGSGPRPARGRGLRLAACIAPPAGRRARLERKESPAEPVPKSKCEREEPPWEGAGCPGAAGGAGGGPGLEPPFPVRLTLPAAHGLLPYGPRSAPARRRAGEGGFPPRPPGCAEVFSANSVSRFVPGAAVRANKGGGRAGGGFGPLRPVPARAAKQNCRGGKLCKSGSGAHGRGAVSPEGSKHPLPRSPVFLLFSLGLVAPNKPRGCPLPAHLHNTWVEDAALVGEKRYGRVVYVKYFECVLKARSGVALLFIGVVAAWRGTGVLLSYSRPYSGTGERRVSFGNGVVFACVLFCFAF